MTLVRAAVAEPLAAGPASGQVHGQGGVAALGPEFGPLGKGRAAASVHEHHARHTLPRFIRPGVIGEDPRRLAQIRLAFVIDLPHHAAALSPSMAGHGLQMLHAPGTGRPLGPDEIRNQEQNGAEPDRSDGSPTRRRSDTVHGEPWQLLNGAESMP